MKEGQGWLDSKAINRLRIILKQIDCHNENGQLIGLKPGDRTTPHSPPYPRRGGFTRTLEIVIK